MNDFFSIDRFVKAFPQILEYLDITFEFLIVCTFWVTIFAVVIALLRIKNFPVMKQILAFYVSYMRGTPFLVQMMVVYYGLPLLVEALFGLDINRWEALLFAEIALIMNESAFFGEIVKAGIQSIPPVQSEAGFSIGMTRTQTFIRIVLPQAIRILIPAYGQTVIGIFQNTSMLYMVGVVDMMARAKSINASTHHSLEAYAVIAIIYITFSLAMKFLFSLLEKKMSYGRR